MRKYMTTAGLILATSVAFAGPGFADSHETKQTVDLLSQAVGQLGQLMKRDIVVVDTSEVIIADTVTNEIGTVFEHDKSGEVGQSLKDGEIRSFKEVSPAYPDGITLQVVPIRGQDSKVIGALIFQP